MYDACVPWPERPKGAKDKSRGPKGLELEVGARRAPKLLVVYISQPCIRRAHRNSPTYIRPPLVGMIYPIPIYIFS